MNKTYFNEKDGHTYYLKNGELYACPTLKDSTPEWESELPVKEFTEPLDKREIKRIKQFLTSRCIVREIQLDKKYYSLNDSHAIVSQHFKGWSSKYKLSAVFQNHPKYEVEKLNGRSGYIITREKLYRLLGDIENKKLK